MVPSPERLYMPRDDEACVPQLLSLCSRAGEPQIPSPRATAAEARVLTRQEAATRGPRAAPRGAPPTAGEQRLQQGRPPSQIVNFLNLKLKNCHGTCEQFPTPKYSVELSVRNTGPACKCFLLKMQVLPFGSLEVSNNKHLMKGSKKGTKKEVVGLFSKKDWYNMKASAIFNIKNIGKTLVIKSLGTKIPSDGLWGCCFRSELC